MFESNAQGDAHALSPTRLANPLHEHICPTLQHHSMMAQGLLLMYLQNLRILIHEHICPATSTFAYIERAEHDGPGVAPPGVAPDVPTKLTHPYPRATGNITRTFTLSCHSAVQSDSPHHATHAGKSGADQALVAEQPSTHAGKHTQDSHAGKQTLASHTGKASREGGAGGDDVYYPRGRRPR